MDTRWGDHGAHGSFDDRAGAWSLELWAETHAKWLAIAAGLGVAGWRHRNTHRFVAMMFAGEATGIRLSFSSPASTRFHSLLCFLVAIGAFGLA